MNRCKMLLVVAVLGLSACAAHDSIVPVVDAGEQGNDGGPGGSLLGGHDHHHLDAGLDADASADAGPSDTDAAPADGSTDASVADAGTGQDAAVAPDGGSGAVDAGPALNACGGTAKLTCYGGGIGVCQFGSKCTLFCGPGCTADYTADPHLACSATRTDTLICPVCHGC